MTWRFRQSFTPIPGIRITLSPSGISTSVGAGPLRYTVGPTGARVTARIPGTGISVQHRLNGGPAAPYDLPASVPQPHSPQIPQTPQSTPLTDQPLQAIKSAGSGSLTTPGLIAFKQALLTAQQQHDTIESELKAARDREAVDGGNYQAWASGWLFRRLFKKRFAELESASVQATEVRGELEEQLKLSTLQTDIDMPDGVAKAFHRLCDDFSALSLSRKIWDNIAARSTNRIAERTIANRVIDRKEVQFKLGRCGVIETNMPVPHLQNANGGDLFLYPGFVLYFASGTNFALLEYAEVVLEVSLVRFHEESQIPTDSEVIGHTWAKANKDGTPDRRFANNYQIPIARYAMLAFTSKAGLNEEYMISNSQAAESFGGAWDSLRRAVEVGQ